jgi:hypothetical protein
MELSLAAGERQRLASLLAATATLLLLVFALAVALPLLPPKLLDPFWQLAFTSALCTNGFLALLAVLLLNLAAALDAEAEWLQARRQLVAGLCRWLVLAFALLIPLQGLAAWRALDWSGAVQARGAQAELQRIAQFRQAVTRATSVAALQANLAAIQAPPLGPEDQRQSLAVLQKSMLSQLRVAEQRARSAATQTRAGAGLGQGGPSRIALLKETLRVVLLSLGLALAFGAAAQRKGSALSLRAEWRQAVEGVLEAGLSRRAETLARQEEEWLQQEEFEELAAIQAGQAAAQQDPPAAVESPAGRGRVHGRHRRGAVDADYFEAIAGEHDEPAG